MPLVRPHHLASIAALAAVAACAASAGSDPAADRDALLAADRDFAAVTAERGLDGWMTAYADDAVRLAMGAEVVQGLGAVREYDSRLFADTTLLLTWEPTDAGVFADGRHGFTTGRSAMVRRGAARDTVYSGAYVTIWRRGDDGRWRVILDTGT